jgi:hypothetical protein
MAGGTVTIVGGNVIHTFTSTGFLAPLDFVNNSLRFRSSATAYLSRTPATTSNRKTWTWSGWMKRGTDKYSLLFAAGNVTDIWNTGTNCTLIGYWISTNQLAVYNNGTVFRNTAQLFRDPAAWYHVVVAFDTTQATAANRLRVYINGSEVTAWDTNNAPTQNLDMAVNVNQNHFVGGQSTNVANAYFDGYLTEINFIDGQQLAPTSFGTFNSYGVWQPITYGGSYGNNGFYLPFPNNSTGSTVSTSYLVVAGGAGGGGGDSSASGSAGAGGGAGGLLTGTSSLVSTASYVVTVGAGGAAGATAAKGSDGTVSTINAITSTGGGAGGSGYADGFPSRATGNSGGSGGGTGGITGGTAPAGGAGTAGQGFAGGGGQASRNGGGGGGASAVGSTSANNVPGGTGGAGTASSISGSSVTYAGGGGGGGWGTPGTPVGNSTGGAGGGGFGGGASGSPATVGQAGTANLGGGGGGGGSWNTGTSSAGGAGGSGVVILSYAGTQRYTGGTVTSSGGNTIHTFTSSGVLTSIFNDFSPQGNNWTGNNFDVTNTTASTYDSMTDVPTLTSATAANYAVLNPLKAGSSSLLSQGNLAWTYSSGSASATPATFSISSGKWYHEVTITSANINHLSGWADATNSVYVDIFNIGATNGIEKSSGTTSGSSFTFANNDVLGIAFDYDNATITFYKNNTLQFSVSGITLSGALMSPIQGIGSSGGGASSCVYNFGQRPFTYTPPSGFVGLNTFNL